MNRRNFVSMVGGASALAAAPSSRYFYFAIIADTHIIDDFYRGPEGNPLDTETIFKTRERLASARALINSVSPAMDKVFLVGDYFHNYPSDKWDFYFQNKTRVDLAKELTDGFRMPVHVGFGNHDYDVPRVSRQFSHDLFKAKYGLQPWYAVDYKGWKFMHLNNFTGETWNPASPSYSKAIGSLGEEQLNWCEAELAHRKPKFVFIHYPLREVADREKADYGLHALLRKYQESIQRVVSGHWHKWYDFARTFGAPHYVMGSTRYDQDAYLLVEVDMKAQTHRFLNQDLIDWSTYYSRPFKSS